MFFNFKPPNQKQHQCSYHDKYWMWSEVAFKRSLHFKKVKESPQTETSYSAGLIKGEIRERESITSRGQDTDHLCSWGDSTWTAGSRTKGEKVKPVGGLARQTWQRRPWISQHSRKQNLNQHIFFSIFLARRGCCLQWCFAFGFSSPKMCFPKGNKAHLLFLFLKETSHPKSSSQETPKNKNKQNYRTLHFTNFFFHCTFKYVF